MGTPPLEKRDKLYRRAQLEIEKEKKEWRSREGVAIKDPVGSF